MTRQTSLGKALPIKYGKARTDAAGYVAENIPVYGSSGVIGTYGRALTTGPSLIVGRKGSAGSVRFAPEPCWPIDTVYYAEPTPDTHLPYFAYLLEHLQLGQHDKSTAIPSLGRDDYNAIEVSVPNVDKQREAVAYLDEQLSRLDASVAALLRAQANLKRYRASVLKAACEGHLVPTEAEVARAEGRTFETGAQLLHRILDGRRARWSSKGKYKEPATAACIGSLPLPEGWTWASVEQVSDQVIDCPHSTAKFVERGAPCIDTNWMTKDGLAIESARYVNAQTYSDRVARLVPQEGDIVFAREGTIGTAVLVPTGMSPCLGQRVMLLRTSQAITNRFLVHALHSDAIISQYREQALGSTVPHINVRDVKRFAVPLPPLAEQHRIVAEADRRLSLIRGAEAQVGANLARAKRLRQSILQAAFAQPGSAGQ